MTDSIKALFDLLVKKEKSGSDYTGTVTRVDGNTAYVQLTGADITDTPVSLSIGAKAGDSVRVRVADGRAWLIGNDSAPPNDSSDVAKDLENTKYDLVLTSAKLDKIVTENIIGINGWINLKDGKFNYGDGALVWDGTTLSVSGTITATSGTIGGFDLSSTALSTDYMIISNDVSTGNTMIKQIDPTNANIMSVLSPYGLTLVGDDVSVEIETLTGKGTFGGEVSEFGVPLSSRYAPISSSDIRLKENIADTAVSGLELINKIQLHTFDWKEDGQHQKIGFIADELEELDPHLAYGGGDDVKAVDTFYLQGYAVKAIQELSAKVDEQQKRIDALEAEIAELKALILQKG